LALFGCKNSIYLEILKQNIEDIFGSKEIFSSFQSPKHCIFLLDPIKKQLTGNVKTEF